MCGFIQSHDKEGMLSDFSFSVSYANNLSKYLMDETRHRQTQSGKANHKDNMSHLMPSTFISWSWRTLQLGFTSTDCGQPLWTPELNLLQQIHCFYIHRIVNKIVGLYQIGINYMSVESKLTFLK